MADVNIIVKATDNASGVLKGLGSIATGVFQGIGQAAFSALSNAGAAMLGFVGGSIEKASSLGESINKVNVVFGESAEAVKAFASNAATSLGQSEQGALEAVGTFGNLLTSIGLLPDSAADMSMSMVGLASDLASFNNASPEDTLLALRSALTGETEPMRRFGVALSADAVAAKAMEMGLAATKDALTPAMKAAATYELILEQTTNAQGDFANTSDGLANRQRILTAQMSDLQAKIGAALVPAMEVLAGVLADDILPAFSDFAENVLPTLIPVITDIAKQFAYFIEALAAGDFESAFDIFYEGLDIFGAMSPEISNVTQAIQAFAVDAKHWIEDVGIPAFMAVVSWIQENWPAIQQAIADGWAAMQPILQAVWDFIQTTVIPGFQAAVAWVVENWPTIQAKIEEVMAAVQGVIEDILTGLKQFWDEWGDEIIGIVNAFVEQFKTLFEAFSLAFEGDWHGFGEKLREGWDEAWRKIGEATQAAIDWFGEQDWAKIGSDIIAGIANGISSATGFIAEAAKSAANAAYQAALGFLGIQSPSKLFAGVGKNMMAGMAQGIMGGVGQPVSAMRSAVTGVTNAVTNNSGGNTYNYYGVQANMQYAYTRAVAGAF